MVDASPLKSLVRLVSNVVSLLTSDVLNRLTTFLLYALVGRHLDARSFGQLSLALALFYTFQVLASLGLPTPLTRIIAKDRTLTGPHLMSASFLALSGGLASLLALAVFVKGMHYASDTTTVVLLLGLGLIPVAMSSVCEAVFRAWERMHLIACANVPVNLGKIAAAYVFLKRGCTLNEVALLLLASTTSVLLIEWTLMLWCIVKPRLRLDLALAWRLARTSFTFLSIDGLIAVWGSITVLILSSLTNEQDVGLFNAACQLLVPLMLFTQCVMIGVFPLLCRQYQLTEAQAEMRRTSHRLIEVLLAVILPGSVALFFLAEPMMVWAYGKPGFAAGGILLQIMVPTVALRVLAAVLGNALLAGERERITLRIVIVDLVASVILGVLLIRQFGVVGAAVAALLVRVIDVAQHYLPAARLLSGLSLSRLAWKSLLAGGFMALVGWASGDLGLIVPLLLGSVVYLGALAALMIYSYGSLHNLRESYFPGMVLSAPSNGATPPEPVPSSLVRSTPALSNPHNEREYEQVS